MWARAGVEVCRLLPVILAALLGDLVLAALQSYATTTGWARPAPPPDSS
ncbi:hypothetical protein ATKI12_8910 [Kitasatospora sp. Ki12]